MNFDSDNPTELLSIIASTERVVYMEHALPTNPAVWTPDAVGELRAIALRFDALWQVLNKAALKAEMAAAVA